MARRGEVGTSKGVPGGHLLPAGAQGGKAGDSAGALRTWIGVLLTLVLLGASATADEIGPGTDWCAALRALPPGHELVLRGGEYAGPCVISRGGTPEAALVIRAKDPADPPRIVYDGEDANVLSIRAAHVVIRGLQFGPTRPGVDAIRIHSGSDIVVENCGFQEIGGIAIVSNSTNVERLTVRRNEIHESKGTGMYFGCHDGVSCSVTDLLIERNYVNNVRAPEGDIGYGLQVKLNSTAIIRDNVIADTKGPGIMVYGATDLSKVSILERNFVGRSRTSSGIVVGGGPAIVRNNVAISSAQAGIGLEDYGNRGLLRRIAVLHNTIYDNRRAGISVPPGGNVDVRILNNAAHARPGVAPFPNGRPGVFLSGNTDCSFILCFLAAPALDFSPLPGAPLISRGRILGDEAAPSDDYFGQPRGLPPTVGAIEFIGRITLGVKTIPGDSSQ